MDYNMLYQTLPKSYIKWSVADMEKFLNFIGLPGLFSKFSKPYLIFRIIVNRWKLLKYSDRRRFEKLTLNQVLYHYQKTYAMQSIFYLGIKKGLYEYEEFILSRSEIQTSPAQNLASLTQKPKLAKISSSNEDESTRDLLKRSSYKSVPETNFQNPPMNDEYYRNQPVRVEIPSNQKMQIQQSSMISECDQDKKKQFELIIQQSDGPQTSFFSVKQQGAKIGRHSSNQILILDESISRFHAEIKFEDSVFQLRDTGSTTGTFIKLVGRSEISHNMIIQMGSNQFKATLEDDILALQIIQGPSLGLTSQISSHKKVTVGRKQTNFLSFPQDQHLSNVHATITPVGQKYYIEDMGTTNGTWRRLSYQGEISPLHQIHDKSVFKIGSSQTYVCTIKTSYVSQKTQPNACIICYENDKDCVYMPCKHNAACIRCSKNLKECPICRQKIEDFVRIYKN